MKNIKWLLLLGTCIQCASPARLDSIKSERGPAYYGAQSTEADLTFDGEILLALPQGLRQVTKKDLNSPGEISQGIRQMVEMQVQHLMGSFQSKSFQKSFGHNQGVLGEVFDIELNDVRPVNNKSFRVTYTYFGRVVFDKNAFKSGDVVDVPITLPLNPLTIYSDSQTKFKNRKAHNYCTDPHYNSEGDFWYFWDPEMNNCPLKSRNKKTLVYRTFGTLLKEPVTEKSLPKYERLYGNNKNGDEFQVSIFFGYIEEDTDLLRKKMVRKRDDAYKAMFSVVSHLEKLGFKLDETYSRDDFAISLASGAPEEVKGYNYLRRLRKSVSTGDDQMDVVVEILLADTNLDARDKTFQVMAAPAFKSSDILVYDGHSGLGGNLDIKQFATNVIFDKTKHQIFYFNGCSSYPYFNGKFFEAKNQGRSLSSNYLDVVTSALPTLSDPRAENVKAFIDPFVQGQRPTWQGFIESLEASNGADAGTYLVGVNGDEDNVAAITKRVRAKKKSR
jgi:hypothetical protein